MRRLPRLVALSSLVLLLLTACGDRSESTAPLDEAAFEQGRYHYPGATWTRANDPAPLGWSTEKLEQARQYAREIESAAVMVVHRGVVVADWGKTDQRFTIQSMRKSLLSALYGVYVAEGRIDLNATLEDLDIDDTPPALTPAEKQARVVDLLQSRSGVYHSALYEVGSWKRRKPARGSHAPGTYWYYNNWDFNALGTIFEQQTGTTIHDAFKQHLADPLQMQDFRPKDVTYLTRHTLSEKFMGNDSDHPAYIFRMTARDLARFGLLYLSKGQWDDERLLSEAWIDTSWDGLDIGNGDTTGTGYGYMWWTETKPNSFPNVRFAETVYFASGARGHRLLIIPYLDLVIAHNVETGGTGLLSQIGRRLFGSNAVDNRDLSTLVRMILEAHPQE